MIVPETKEAERDHEGGKVKEGDEGRRGKVKGRALEGYKKAFEVMTSSKKTDRLGLHEIFWGHLKLLYLV